jgi:CSLREA domain-containing protein
MTPRASAPRRVRTSTVALLFFLAAARSVPVGATIYTVNSTDDFPDADLLDGVCGDVGGACTLRAAIQQANYDASGPSTIAFNISPGGAQTITLSTSLDSMDVDDLLVDGTTQPGWVDDPLIEVTASDTLSVLAVGDGFTMNAAGQALRKIVVTKMTGAGVHMTQNAVGCLVDGCYLGTDRTSAANKGNGYGVRIHKGISNTVAGFIFPSFIAGNKQDGVLIEGDDQAVVNLGNEVRNCYIGLAPNGTKLANGRNGVFLTYAAGNTISGNIISGNGSYGIRLSFDKSTLNFVTGNYIGTNTNGTAAIGNSDGGIYLFGAPQNTIGITNGRNVIAGNTNSGILVSATTGMPASGNVIQNNYIGTDKNGNNPLPNTLVGIEVSGAPNTQIGGPTAMPGQDPGNIIAGNGSHGIRIGGTTGAIVKGNSIGTAQNGNVLANGGKGILIEDSQMIEIGGVNANDGNLVKGNLETGVSLRNAKRITIDPNLISGNGGLGIDLDDDGVVLVNDPGDGDMGANDGQNYPDLITASSSGSTIVVGALHSAASESYRLEFFSSTACDASGHGEGESFIDALNIVTDGTGNADFSLVTPVSVSPGTFVTATAIDSVGNTSEFSACITVAADVAASLDHYKCYQGKDLKNPKFLRTTVGLTDQFESPFGTDVLKPKFVCIPVNKNGEGIINPSAHLTCYQLKGANLAPRPRVDVSTQFQSSRFELKKAKLICLPSTNEMLP